MSDIVVVVEKKSQLFDPIFKAFPYPIAGAIVRGLRGFIAVVMPAIIAAVADGSIFANIHFIPQGNIPLIVAIATPIVLGIDKWLREKGLEDELKDLPTSLVTSGPPKDETNLLPPPDDIPPA